MNSVLAVFTIPLVVGLSARFLSAEGAQVGLQPDKLVQVGAIVLVPVALGMLLRRRRPVFAARMDRPVRTVSVVALVLAVAAAIGQQVGEFVSGLAAVGLLCLLFSVLSIGVGYTLPRLARVGRPQAVAAAMEVGIHNAVLAITVAVTVLDSPAAAVAPAIYGVLMFLPAAVFAHAVARRREPAAPVQRGRSSR